MFYPAVLVNLGLTALPASDYWVLGSKACADTLTELEFMSLLEVYFSNPESKFQYSGKTQSLQGHSTVMDSLIVFTPSALGFVEKKYVIAYI